MELEWGLSLGMHDRAWVKGMREFRELSLSLSPFLVTPQSSVLPASMCLAFGWSSSGEMVSGVKAWSNPGTFSLISSSRKVFSVFGF